MERGSAEAKQRSAEAKQRSADADRKSAEYDRRSADADRKSAEYDRRSADADREIIRGTNSRLNNLVKFYNLYKNNPSSIKQNEINHMMRSAKEIVQDCKEYGIDYKAKLPLEVRKFYGID